jgi:hypothetical protein
LETIIIKKTTKMKLNAKEIGDVVWVVCVYAAIVSCTIAGWIDVPTCLGFVFLLLLHGWHLVNAAKARVKAETEQAKMKERLAEAEKILKEFYEDFRGVGIGPTTRMNYRAYKNKYPR